MLTLFKKTIWIILTLALLALFSAYAYQRNWLKTDVLAYLGLKSNQIEFPAFLGVEKKPTETQPVDNDEDLEKLGVEGISQIKILGDRAKESGEKAQDFFSEAIKVDEDSQESVSDKAFEYGRYIYCQQVVKEYEAKEASPSTTSSP